jgi:hypothetical protein
VAWTLGLCERATPPACLACVRRPDDPLRFPRRRLLLTVTLLSLAVDGAAAMRIAVGPAAAAAALIKLADFCTGRPTGQPDKRAYPPTPSRLSEPPRTISPSVGALGFHSGLAMMALPSASSSARSVLLPLPTGPPPSPD